ncbi:MAG: peptidase S10 [Acidobacteriota bacterium]|nr:peptidase S10 [Acidobacteriota bacterium]
MKRLFSVLLVAAALTNAQQQSGDAPPETQNKRADDGNKHVEPAKPAEEKLSVTHHKMTLNGKSLAYTATAGRLPIKNDQGKTEADMFFVAYTLDSAGGAKRPLTFAFNGGPGSATIWLHMGAFGPKRVKMQPNGFMPAPPFELEDNQSTLLDRSDLVFVDAIGTGYSRAATPELGKKFWTVNGDIEAFGEFIRLYLQKNSRWGSPLYLAGESYGTTRAAGLSGYLVDHGIALNGIVLISTILQFQTVSFVSGNDMPYVMYLPTYAMSAAYHHKLAPELEGNLDALREEVEKWASKEYLTALQQGDALSEQARQSVASHLARYTGLNKEYIERCNLRVDLWHFDTDLLRDRGLMIGRLDGRFTGPEESKTEQHPDFDPSEAAIRPPYTSVFGDYVKQELGYESEMQYYVLGGGVKGWDFETTGWSGFANTSAALRRAFAKNPYMRVFIAEGMYDAATPYFAVDYTFNHMDLTAAAHKNITRDHFSAGHMVYIDDASMQKLKLDIDHLYDETARR